jgi:hypothetical protein
VYALPCNSWRRHLSPVISFSPGIGTYAVFFVAPPVASSAPPEIRFRAEADNILCGPHQGLLASPV